MKEPIFIDVEATARGKIKELGIVFGNESLRTSSIKEALKAIEGFPTNYIAGHNFIDFDKKLLEKTYLNRNQKVLVSTIHKAKGREFDTVVLLAHKVRMDDEMKRLFYVGMTRAKKRLIIVTNNNDFCDYAKTLVTTEIDETIYPEPKAKTFVMGLADLYLGFNRGRDIPALDLIAGTKIKAVKSPQGSPYGLEQNARVISRFSKNMFGIIKGQEQKGYVIQDIEIENVVSWYDENSGQYRQQPLCKVVMIC